MKLGLYQYELDPKKLSFQQESQEQGDDPLLSEWEATRISNVKVMAAPLLLGKVIRIDLGFPKASFARAIQGMFDEYEKARSYQHRLQLLKPSNLHMCLCVCSIRTTGWLIRKANDL